MGILNITPDSFSDGGLFFDVEKAACHAEYLIQSGASIIDIGGESTRPGFDPVSPEEEQQRVLPVIHLLKEKFPHIPLSLDTRNPSTAQAGLEEGVDIINDISGLTSPEMITVCQNSNCGLIVMHMQGEPKTMQAAPRYEDVIREVNDFFRKRFDVLTQAGIQARRICFDPGIGFGKTTAHNIELVSRADKLDTCGCALMMALSRKRFMGEILSSTEDGRLPVSTALATVLSHQKGIRYHRVHDVRDCAVALKLLYALD